jgi:hypothetical protein
MLVKPLLIATLVQTNISLEVRQLLQSTLNPILACTLFQSNE